MSYNTDDDDELRDRRWKNGISCTLVFILWILFANLLVSINNIPMFYKIQVSTEQMVTQMQKQAEIEYIINDWRRKEPIINQHTIHHNMCKLPQTWFREVHPHALDALIDKSFGKLENNKV